MTYRYVHTVSQMGLHPPHAETCIMRFGNLSIVVLKVT